MKKKALAVSLVAGLVAPMAVAPMAVGVPFIDNSIAGGTVYAAGTATESDRLQKRLQTLRSKLTGADLTLANTMLAALQNMKNETNKAENQALIQPIWNKIRDKKGNQSGYDLITQENILRLFLEFAITYDSSATGRTINDVLTDPQLRPIMDQLLKLSGLTNGMDDFAIKDINDFLDAISPELKSQISGLKDITAKKLIDLAKSINDEYDRLVYKGGTAVTNLKISKVLSGLGITSDAWNGTAVNVIAKLLNYNPNPGGGTGSNTNNGNGNDKPTGTEVKDPDGTTTTEYELGDDLLDKLLGQLGGGKQIELDLSSSKSDNVAVELPSDLWESAGAGDILDLKLPYGVDYKLPLDALELDELAASLGIDAKDLKLNFEMKKLPEAKAAAIKTAAAASGVEIIGDIFEFSLTATTPDGKIVEIKSFGGTYALRNFSLNSAVNPSQTTAVLVDKDGKFQFVPATFKTADNKTTVTMRRTGNSTYTVVKSNKSFADLKGHWAEADVNLLASKLLVDGVTETSFAPDATVKRSEFATLLVRALGLVEEEGTVKFSDVKTGYWASGAINAAVQAGLIEGFEDGSFRPEDPITREQMAVMASRSLKFVGKVPNGSPTVLQYFKDRTSISGWAEAALAQSVQAGILEGELDQKLAPAGKATRAQAAAVFKRLLQYAEFID